MTELLNNMYRLGRLLGSGVEADVFEAEAVKLNRKVALKMFRRAHGDGELLERLKKLKGNYIGCCATVLDLFEHNDRIVAVLELVNGVPLQDLVASNHWSLKKREMIAEQLLTAIKELHDEKLSHGDLSPNNVFVCGDGTVKLIDPRVSSGCALGAVFGTANYTAPELLVFNSVATPAADVFSLSALIYQVFEGQDPFGCQSSEEYVFKIGTKTLVPKPFKSTPGPFRRAISAGLDLDPRTRPRTVDQFLKLKQDRVRKRFVLALGALAVVITAGAFLTLKRRVSFDDMLGVRVLKVEDADLFVLDGVGKAPFYVRPLPASNSLVVCNAHSPYLSFISLDPKPTLEGKVQLGGHHSHDFVPYASNSRALISSSVTDSVVVLDLKTLRVQKVIGNENDTQWFLHPDAVAVSEANAHAYVTSWRGGFVTVIDLKGLRPIKKINVNPGPSGAVVSRDGQFLYVSHTVVRFNPESRVSEGVMTVIDTRTNRIVRKIPNVGKESSDVKVIPGTDIAITANYRGQSLSMIDTSGQAELHNIALNHGSPIDQVVSRAGPYVYVANFNHPYIHVVNYQTRAVLLALQSKHFGRETNGITLSEDEKYLCLTNTETDQVVCLKNRIAEWERLAR